MTHKLTICDHPLIQHKMAFLRQKETGSGAFRRLVTEISRMITYEVTRDFPLQDIVVETPLMETKAHILADKKVCIVPILRAGLGILEGVLDIIPHARVGHIGLYRDHETLEAHRYFFKMPDDLGQRSIIVVDPMLATAHSAIAAIEQLSEHVSTHSIKFMCLVAAPEGVQNFHQAYPEIPIFAAALDDRLNEQGYILPGLGDAGDRLYGTK